MIGKLLKSLVILMLILQFSFAFQNDKDFDLEYTRDITGGTNGQVVLNANANFNLDLQIAGSEPVEPGEIINYRATTTATMIPSSNNNINLMRFVHTDQLISESSNRNSLLNFFSSSNYDALAGKRNSCTQWSEPIASTIPCVGAVNPFVCGNFNSCSLSSISSDIRGFLNSNNNLYSQSSTYWNCEEIAGTGTVCAKFPNQNSKYKSFLYPVCKGEIDLSSGNTAIQNLKLSGTNPTASINQQLPDVCFNDFSKRECNINAKLTMSCIPVATDNYGSSSDISFLYPPFSLTENVNLDVPICHGFYDFSFTVNPNPLTISSGATQNMEIVLTNNGDFPIEILSGGITALDGFTFQTTYPIEISKGATKTIQGTITAPNNVPNSFRIRVNVKEAQNALACAATQTDTSKIQTVNIQEQSCNIEAEFSRAFSSLCQEELNQQILEVSNLGEGSIVVDNFFAILGVDPTNRVTGWRPITTNVIPQLDNREYQTDLNLANNLLTNASLFMVYHKQDDLSCQRSLRLDFQTVDCSSSSRYDVAPFLSLNPGTPIDNENVIGRFRILNYPNLEPSSPITANYTIRSGSQVITGSFNVGPIASGSATPFFDSDELLCTGSITFAVDLQATQDDIDPSNNNKSITRSCGTLPLERAYCEFIDGTTSVSKVILDPGNTKSLGISCYRMVSDDDDEQALSLKGAFFDNYNFEGYQFAESREEIDCYGTGNVFPDNSEAEALRAKLVSSGRIGEVYENYKGIEISSRSDAAQNEQESFDISIERRDFVSGSEVNLKIECSIDAEVSSPDCLYYI